MQLSVTLISGLFKPVNMRSRNFRNGVTWSYTGYKAHSSSFFLYSCNSRTNELLEHQNKTKWFSSNLNIWFALKRIHVTLEITPGYIYAHRSAFMAKRRDFIPQKNQKLSQNTNMFFQPVSDFYTLIMGLLVHSWFEIMEFSQILIIPAFWHWKMSV